MTARPGSDFFAALRPSRGNMANAFDESQVVAGEVEVRLSRPGERLRPADKLNRAPL